MCISWWTSRRNRLRATHGWRPELPCPCPWHGKSKPRLRIHWLLPPLREGWADIRDGRDAPGLFGQFGGSRRDYFRRPKGEWGSAWTAARWEPYPQLESKALSSR